jgi:hypothetical protein
VGTSAPLPKVYQAAQQALTQCFKVDECKDWADKATALASYARQTEDRSLEDMAKRIKGRALRRCGELLKEIEPKPGARTDTPPRGDAPPRSVTRKQAAEDAGLSRDQAKQAIQIANIEPEQFELAIEAPEPPTIVELVAQAPNVFRQYSKPHVKSATTKPVLRVIYSPAAERPPRFWTG